MVIYLIPIIITGIFSLNIPQLSDPKLKKKVYRATWIYVTLIAALRYGIGKDYVFYRDIFEWNIAGEAKGLVGGLYYHISRIIDAMGGNYTWVIVLSSILLSYSVYTVFSTYLKETDLFFAFFIYLTCGMYFSSYNIFRQYIAISFFMLSLVYYFEKKHLPMFLMLIFTYLFHSATIVSMALLFCFFVFKNNKNLIKLFMIAYIVSLVFIFIDIQQVIALFADFLPNKYASYVNNKELFLNRNELAVLKLVIPNITMILLLERNKQIVALKAGKEILFGMLFFVTLNNLFYGIVSLTRFSEMVFIFVPLSVVFLFNAYQVDDKGRLEQIKSRIAILKNIELHKILKVSFLLYYFILTVVTIFMMNGNGVMPYQNIVMNLFR